MVLRIGELDKNLRLAAKPLFAYRLIVCASPQYLTRHGWPRHPTDLREHECLVFFPWPTGLLHHWPSISAKGDPEVKVKSRLAINDWGALLEAALQGNGVLIGYEKGLEKPIKNGELITLLGDYKIPERTMNLLYDPSRINETRYKVFIDELCEYFN
jgi:DNA-binding transcriptional LysR family regulator